MTWIDDIRALGPCTNAIELLERGNYASLQDAWDQWADGSHMLWLIGMVAGGKPGSPERRRLATCAAECAELALPIWELRFANDDRPRRAIEAAKRGDPKECRATSASAAHADTEAAADAADAAAAAAHAADVAAYAAAYAAAAAAARILARCADIVRVHYPVAPEVTQ